MKAFIPILSMFLLAACGPEPREINYGHEACEYCRMTIVDDRYAAQLVTPKNKVFCFDAVECLIHFKEERKDQQWAYELLTDYLEPKQLIPADEAFILRSKELPSPMGMYLTGLQSMADAQQLKNQHGGNIYHYRELEETLDVLPAL